jgi:hypothetical protein
MDNVSRNRTTSLDSQEDPPVVADSDCMNKRAVTAGIICFSVHPQTDMIYLLLGKETRNGNIVGRWCDFGGALMEDETVEQAAAREFTEETICALDMTDTWRELLPVDHTSTSRTPSFSHYQHYIENMLLNEEYTARVKLLTNRASERVAREYFLKRIQWQPRTVEYFNAIRSSLLRLHRLNGHQQPNTHHISRALALHPSLSMVHGSEGRAFSVDRDFLEKQQIQYWSLDRLEEVLQENGQWRHHLFRQSFLPVLRIVVDQLRQLYYS